MKSLILASVALVLATGAHAFDAYVGVERDTKADNTIAYVGGEQGLGDFTVSAQLNADLNKGDRGSVQKVELDASYAVTNNLSVYLQNDLDKDFKRTETTLGAKWKF